MSETKQETAEVLKQPEVPARLEDRLKLPAYSVDEAMKLKCLDRASIFVRYLPACCANELFIRQLFGNYGKIVAINFMGPFKVRASTFRPFKREQNRRFHEYSAFGAFVKYADWHQAMNCINQVNDFRVEPIVWFNENSTLIKPNQIPQGRDLETPASVMLQIRIASRTPCKTALNGNKCEDEDCAAHHEVNLDRGSMYTLDEINKEKHLVAQQYAVALSAWESAADSNKRGSQYWKDLLAQRTDEKDEIKVTYKRFGGNRSRQ